MGDVTDRRAFLIGALPAGAALLTGAPLPRSPTRPRPLALVYRGPAASPGCPESVAALLERAPARFRTAFCGPGERIQLTPQALAAATLYAGRDPGFALLPGDSGEYIESRGAEVTDLRDTVISVRWRDRVHRVYFQDGPYFTLRRGAHATTLARYENGLAAAVVARSGAGCVGVVGPHPEAGRDWFAGLPLRPVDARDLGEDLVTTTLTLS